MLTTFTIDNILGNQKNKDKDFDFEIDEEVEAKEEKSVIKEESVTSDNVKLNSRDQFKSYVERQNPSYTSIIAQAILSSPNNKLSLGSIYEYIASHFPDFLKKGQGWRNCVRHNLSLSECFIKAGRAKNGRGNDWGIHPRYEKNFSKGDYRKRRISHRSRQREFDFMFNSTKYCFPYIQKNEYFNNVAKRKAPFSIENILSDEKATAALPPDITDEKSFYDYRSKINSFRQLMNTYSPAYSSSTLSSNCISTHSARYLKPGHLCSC